MVVRLDAVLGLDFTVHAGVYSKVPFLPQESMVVVVSARIGIVQPFALLWKLVYTLACTTSVLVLLPVLDSPRFRYSLYTSARYVRGRW